MRMCELLVGLPDVTVLGVVDLLPSVPIVVHIETVVDCPERCPECGAEFGLDSIEVGEIIQCPECGVELEVLETSPVQLALAPDEEEDWGE
jgi:alpha-aminoadipate/glutamate carrier protein LysW